MILGTLISTGENMLSAFVTGRLFPAAAAGAADVADNSLPSDVQESVQEVTSEATQEVNQFVQFFEDHIPDLVAFGVRVLLALILFFVGSKIIKWIRKVVRKSFERTNADAGVSQFVDSMLKFGLYALLLFIIATKFGVESSSVAALIASAGVAIGLAVQGSLSNFAGGVLILLLKPFAVGDYIIVTQEGIEGTVKEIQIFYTKLATVDNQTVVVPNSILTNNSLTNVTARPERKLDLKVGISYDADLKKAKSLIEDMLLHDESIIQDEEIRVFVDSLGDSAVMIGLRAWVKTEEYWATRWRLMEEIKLTFDAEGIDIPYNQLTVHVREEG
ncbi:mechanosensitive ion channel family protein [[Ruminococcus] torques]|uniref:mechanosensitive ion channel family protein n=1 Tax=[Ruminococcus] torques TaxID=33039 RepID=UPI0025A363BB|nr:mechanosensitive ion channel domain-containing protein [[Ruminococcus] torques]MDM8236136.1 mechanosensitive ion channel [[Ruminococcus] torques]